MQDGIFGDLIDFHGISGRLAAATPGRWYADVLNDRYASSMVVVTTEEPDPSQRFYLRWRDYPSDSIVAVTLLQTNMCPFLHASSRWDQNADFMAYARSDVGVLLAEVHRLRAALDGSGSREAGEEPIDLHGIAERLARAVPGPWYVDDFEDRRGNSILVVVSQEPTWDKPRSWLRYPRDAVVAATLVQNQDISMCHSGGRSAEDAEFIAHARNDVAILLTEVHRLRAILYGDNSPSPRGGG